MTTVPLENLWQLAGLEVDNPRAAAKPWDRAPLVDIEGDRLRWQYVRLEGDEEIAAFGPIRFLSLPVETGVQPRLLIEFVDLADKTDDAIAAFARKWGLLHPCAHNVPRTHPPLVGEFRTGPFCDTVDAGAVAGSEPLAIWRVWASMGRAVVRIASQHRLETNGEQTDWRFLLPEDQGQTVAEGSLEVAKARLATVVEVWLRIGAVQPKVDPLRPPHLFVSGVDLFGAIALQLAMVVTSSRGLSFCSGCGSAYSPTHQPTARRRHYCDDCRDAGVPVRDASAAYRGRHGAA